MNMCLNVALLVAAAVPTMCFAQAAAEYPSKPVKVLVGYQAGGPTDLTARLIATKLQTALGQAFVVDNKPGAGSNIASEQAASSPADGYTLLVAASQMTWNSALYKNVKYDPVRSFVPISKIMASPAVLVVSPNLPIKTVADLVSLAKREPSKISFASSGNGTVPHLSGELFKSAAGVQMTHVPYKGAGPALTDLLGGQVDVSFMTALSAIQYVKDGKLRALAVVSNERLPQLPNVPTLKESGISGVDVESWNGLFAPAGTPPSIVQKLSDAVVKIMKEPDVRKVFVDQAATPIGNSSSEFAAEVRAEVQRNNAFIKSANLKID
ncbi:tripartite tricarboxylate transporter substrate binding protein [Variovorax ureilyticus]|uniref:Tripartite tricarboxylate transporter substrate binding protein n=1 Tax=Variovorax ureilyticus TaxID=1836198 RepID=A0ABU8VRT3_9BURK